MDSILQALFIGGMLLERLNAPPKPGCFDFGDIIRFFDDLMQEDAEGGGYNTSS